MSCPDCFKGSIHNHTDPKGTTEKEQYGYKTYVSLPPNDPNPKSTIIFLTDAFGLYLPNNMLLADHYAGATGCRVLVPDLIPGGAAPLWVMHAMNDVFRPIGPAWTDWLNPLTYVGKGWAVAKTIYGFVPFAIRADAVKAYPAVLAYAKKVREGMPADGKLGVAGFCWGGYPSTKLCTEDVGGKPLIDAQFNAHPSSLKVPDMVVDAIRHKVPYSCAVAEFDIMFDKKVADETEAAVREKVGGPGQGQAGPYEFVLWKGAHHGFSVRASFDEGSVGKETYEGSAKQAVDWFNKYLH